MKLGDQEDEGEAPEAEDVECEALLAHVVPAERTAVGGLPSLEEMLQELKGQATIAGPQYFNMVTQNTIVLVCIAAVGQLGELDLAAASMSISLYTILGQSVILSMIGALDTQGSQAYGAQRYDQLGIICQRTILFLLLHCIPISLMFAALPWLLAVMGQDPSLTAKVTQYVIALLPTIYIHSLIRPTNRILLAQRVAVPQACAGGLTLILHLPITYLGLRWCGYVGAAYGYTLTSCCNLALICAYVCLSRKSPRVWGRPSWEAIKGWGVFARLAYSSCAMKCMEVWAFGSMTLWAGKLPHPSSAVASVGVAFSVYGFLFMAYGALSMAVCARVGNHLGGGNAHRARTAALTGLAAAPCILILTGVLLVEPHCQALLLRAFAGADTSPQLRARVRGLLRLLAVMQACDCVQSQMQGVVQGAGRQSRGVLINLVAYYVCGLPAAVLLAFYLGFDVNGLVLGMIVGTSIQAMWYTSMVLRLDWDAEASSALDRVAHLAAALADEIVVEGGEQGVASECERGEQLERTPALSQFAAMGDAIKRTSSEAVRLAFRRTRIVNTTLELPRASFG